MNIRRLMLSLILCTCGLTISAFGQPSPRHRPAEEEKSRAPVAASDEPTLYCFPLHDVQAELALRMIQSVLVKTQDGAKSNANQVSPRFAVDTRMNRILAYVDRPTEKAIAALLLKLDQPLERDSPGPKLTALKLRYASPSDVQAAMNQLSLNESGVMSYADERTKTFFARGPEEGIVRLKALVERLDVAPPPARPREGVLLRIVWLVDKSVAGADAPAVPDDYKSPIERLRKQLGFGELRVATQMVVSFDPVDGAQFESTALVKFQQPCVLEASGRMSQKGPGEPQLRLQLSAKTLPQANHEGKLKELCKLDTTCSGALQWQPMIVGMTTVGSQPSVFVIQFLPN
jgi:Bacterial type II/III secretion system short domain